jgi:hypothetical protein
MAIVQNTLIGASRKKVGGTVFSSWKGINVLRSKPLTVANPRTDDQVFTRNNLAAVVAIYRGLAPAVNVGYAEQAVRKSAYNAFTSDTLLNATTAANFPDADIDPALLKVSKGSIAPTDFNIISLEAATGELRLNWPTTVQGSGQSVNDTLVIGVLDEATGVYRGIDKNQIRRGVVESMFLDFDINPGSTYRIYAGFVNARSRKAADSWTNTVIAS